MELENRKDWLKRSDTELLESEIRMFLLKHRGTEQISFDTMLSVVSVMPEDKVKTALTRLKQGQPADGHGSVRMLAEMMLALSESERQAVWEWLAHTEEFYQVGRGVDHSAENRMAMGKILPVLAISLTAAILGKRRFWVLFGIGVGGCLLYIIYSVLPKRPPKPVTVGETLLSRGDEEWLWSVVTRVDVQNGETIVLYVNGARKCSLKDNRSTLIRFLKDVRRHGIPITVGRQEYTERIEGLFI